MVSNMQGAQDHGCQHTDAMSVLLNATVVHRGEIVIDDVHYIAHVDATSSDTSGDQNGSQPAAETTQCSLTLLLGAVGVHRCAGKLQIVEEVIQLVSSPLAVDENDGASGRQRLQKIDESRLLIERSRLVNHLLDVPVGATGTTDAQTDMSLGQMVLGQVPELLGESGREQHVSHIPLLDLCSRVKTHNLVSNSLDGK